MRWVLRHIHRRMLLTRLNNKGYSGFIALLEDANYSVGGREIRHILSGRQY